MMGITTRITRSKGIIQYVWDAKDTETEEKQKIEEEEKKIRRIAKDLNIKIPEEYNMEMSEDLIKTRPKRFKCRSCTRSYISLVALENHSKLHENAKHQENKPEDHLKWIEKGDIRKEIPTIMEKEPNNQSQEYES
jgi:hypothetical protein